MVALHSVKDKACIVNANRGTGGNGDMESPGAWAEEVDWRGSAKLSVALKRSAGHVLFLPAIL